MADIREKNSDDSSMNSTPLRSRCEGVAARSFIQSQQESTGAGCSDADDLKKLLPPC